MDRWTDLQITTVSQPLMPQSLYQATTQMLRETDMSWEEFIPALQYAYNTS